MTKGKAFRILGKAVLQFVFFTALFSSTVFMYCSCKNTSYSSFASFLVKQRGKNSVPFNYGEVKTRDLQNYQSFYTYADDRPGSNLKDRMHTFFKAVQDDESQYLFSRGKNTIKADTLLYTTWNFEEFHYGFDIFRSQAESNEYEIKEGEVYISEAVALKLFPDCQANYSSIINNVITCSNTELIVKGIVLKDSLGFIGSTIGQSFVLGNFNFKPFKTNKLIYNFIIFGSEIDVFADIVCIEGAIASLKSDKTELESFYYDYNGSFFLDESQLVKNSTICNPGKNAVLKATSISSFIVLVAILFFYFSTNNKSIRKIRNVIRRPNLCNLLDFYTTFFGLVLVLSISKAIGLIRIGNTVISLLDFNIVTPVFVIWITFSILIIAANTNFKIRKDERNISTCIDYCKLKI